MQLSEIWVYPVKSLSGIRLTEAEVLERGLKYDRQWMIVDDNNVFITQRVFHKMALIDVSLEETGMRFSNRLEEDNEVFVPFNPETNETVTVKIWEAWVDAVTVSPDADKWLSKELGQSLRLVMMPTSTERKVPVKYAKNGENVGFADDFPYLIISQASLDDLNTRLLEPVAMKRFRPNFVVAGTMPFEEDQWKKISIGGLDFELLKPCARCVLTTIDPVTAQKGKEPLKTLSTYRMFNKKILFGQNVVATSFGTVKEGDTVTVMEI
ncbi:MOSC domain-containing protein [Dyadobacter sp. CY323]|uniref:MOSC domain-containing protein n=1 Tax=Dyadobacter sp. CY323 TaxID=2907302 RepID=UPI001F41F12C|nr:MOSC N-terminal beta barrel domain-containing protein [Dyadobacter sp. CY323]MCE6988132.1 MOSC domain-containing protein [Dyadobacter sp. CY323]